MPIAQPYNKRGKKTKEVKSQPTLVGSAKIGQQMLEIIIIIIFIILLFIMIKSQNKAYFWNPM